MQGILIGRSTGSDDEKPESFRAAREISRAARADERRLLASTAARAPGTGSYGSTLGKANPFPSARTTKVTAGSHCELLAEREANVVEHLPRAGNCTSVPLIL